MGIKVKVCHSGNYSTNYLKNEYLVLKKGETRDDIPEEVIARMIQSKTKWIEVVKEEKPEKTTGQDDISPKEKQIRDILEAIRKTAGQLKAKESLEKWGKENLGVDVDRRKRAKEIIKDLVAEYMRQAGDE
jgi:hypothetical protein